MAKTIEEGFRGLRANLEITDLEEETVSARQKSVRKALENDFNMIDSFLTGSYRRGTMIAPLKEADVDVFVVLDSGHFQKRGQSALLQSVKKVLKKTCPTTLDISPNGHAVRITFTDFKVDVVPSFYRKGGGFLIPDTNRSAWIPTDPKRHVELWTASDKAHNGDFVPLLKMLKAWNKGRSIFCSFHLEVLAYIILNGVTIFDFPSGVRFVFDKARDKIRDKLPDPAGCSDDVAAHVDTQAKIDKRIQGLQWAYENAKSAEVLAAAGDIKGAFAKWNRIFNGQFPAYG
jgi:hypothetical protein